MTIGLTGATGFIGGHVVRAAAAARHTVIGFSRSFTAGIPGAAEVRAWNPATPPDLAGISALIHLAGEPILGLWTRRRRTAILESRVEGTRRLVAAMAASSPRPEALVCASAIGFYGDRGDEVLDESSEPGTGFLADVTRAWEAEAAAGAALGIRTTRARLGVVLGSGGGAWPILRRAFAMGLGGRLGSGRQWTSWIRVDDAAALLVAAATDPRYSGALNVVAPEPVTNRELTHTLARVLRRPAVVPVPAALLRLTLRDQAAMFLASQRVVPAEPLRLGHRFAARTFEEAVVPLVAGSRDPDSR